MIRHSRRLRGAVALTVFLLMSFYLVNLGGAAQAAGPNLVVNPGLEVAGPQCFATYGWGTSTVSSTLVATGAHGGTHAAQIAISGYVSGDYKLMPTQSAACAPTVAAGHTYTASVWYHSTSANNSLTLFYFSAGKWQYWTDLKKLPAVAAWTQATATTPAVPAGVTQVSFGVSLSGNGTLTTDDYSLTDPTGGGGGGGSVCVGTAVQCAKGQWTVQTFPNTVRAIHTIVLHDGRILFMAGSGNDMTAFGMNDFKSTVWNPTTNVWTDIATPSDVFCSGHAILPNGNVLIIGGTYGYPAADGSHTFEGLKSSYIFNVATNTYQRVNDLNTGHWYPSATELGNGDILSMGGLDEAGQGTVTNEQFDNATQKWLPYTSVPQQWNYFGLYPTNILTDTGKLFYTGSHVFGSQGPGAPGADLIDLGANTITPVPGLQNINERDQSAAVLLPPAQSQRVAILGGGNVDTNVDANRLTDLIDLSVPNPTYTPGPLLPQGTTEMGNGMNMTMNDPGVVPETGTQGKLYVSAVITPDRKVLETGGALHNRADPVYEASSFNPANNTFTPMAVDPIERMYHSESILYQDGRIISVGSNPGDGSFVMKISIYQPPYKFMSNPPTIATAPAQWGYGSQQTITGSNDITSAELITPAAVTHSSDSNARLVDLPLVKNAAGQYTVTLTGNANLEPPGWKMLFVQNAAGVPSVAKWIHVGGN